MTKETILLYNSGTWFRKRLRINYYEFEGIYHEPDNRTPRWIKFWGIGGGRISVKYLGRQRRFGQDLNNHQAEKLIQQLRAEIEKHTPANT